MEILLHCSIYRLCYFFHYCFFFLNFDKDENTVESVDCELFSF